MNIREISKPVTAKALNESLARRFGQRIALENFTLDQLQDARNKLRTKLSQIETNESFDAVSNSDKYQKNRLFLDVLNAEISERENIVEAVCEDCKEEPCVCETNEGKYKSDAQRKAIHANKKKNETVVREGAEDEAELVMAAKDMVDRVTGWMEDTAEMQTESMLELADAIRDEMGAQQSEQFVATVKPALEGLYTAMESTREALTNGVGMLTGESMPSDMMGTDDGMDDLDTEMEPTIDQDPVDDGMGASEPAAGGEEPAGRARRESKQYSKKAIAERSRRLATTLSKKK